MKNTVIFFLLFLFLTSCNDLLEINDPNSVVENTFYQNEEQVEQAVNGIYGQLQEIVANQYIFNELPSDNTIVQINPQNRGQVNRVEAMTAWTYEATSFNINQMYDDVYNTIHNINTVIFRMQESDLQTDKRNQFLGEMLFLRAYHYFNLVQYFGPVVLLTEPIDNVDSSFEITRSSEEEVYNQIISDLNEASDLLPLKSDYSSSDIGRVPKGAALSLLGKTYLTIGEYDNAVTALNQVTQLGYQLLNDYGDIFDTNNKNHSESIFEVQYRGDDNLGLNSEFLYRFSPFNENGAITGFTTAQTFGWNIPSNSIMREFDDDDLRKDVSFQDGFVGSDGEFVAIQYINKFNNPHSTAGVTNDNWPVIRYADVLLMLAEAINEENGPTGEAYGYVNEVRLRAGLAPLSGLTQDEFREAVLTERRIELAFENHRWFDIKRTRTIPELVTFLNEFGQEELDNPSVSRSGISFGTTDYQFTDFKAFFPLPADEVNLSAGLEQNPGY